MSKKSELKVLLLLKEKEELEQKISRLRNQVLHIEDKISRIENFENSRTKVSKETVEENSEEIDSTRSLPTMEELFGK